MASSQLDNLKEAVSKVEAGCAEVALAVQQARGIAEEQANWAVQMGIGAHHSALRQVADALDEAYRQCETAHNAAGRAKSAVQQFNDRFGRNDLAASSDSAAEQLCEASAAIATASGKIDNDATANATLSQDENLMNAVNTAASVVSEAITTIDIAAEAVTGYRAAIEAALRKLNRDATTPSATPATGAPRNRRPLPMDPRGFDGEGMAGIRPYDEAGTAEANLFFRDGKHNDHPIHATHGTTNFWQGEVKPAWRHTKPAQGHIEGNAAADMLHHGQSEAVLYLNAEPCDYGGDGCKDNTAHYLKPGATMHIRVFDAGGRMRYRKRVTGTGEALTDE